MHPYVRVLQAYMDAPGRSDYGTVKKQIINTLT